ncbi:MAG: LysM peptidoglycan-binding domain-containing protein, partial [Terrimicrobiaceae bacterium]|nr:LysM peptidoglycan-binding domain-containing protein [Terrimicrobiaceae bacterium]
MGGVLKVLLVLGLAGAIFGTSAYFAYELFWKPKKLEALEKKEAEAAASLPPPPHPSLALLDEAKAAIALGNASAARQALETIVEDPSAPVLSEARGLLGEMNIRELFSPAPFGGKTPYTVVRGDALAKIAARTGAGAELIYRVNNLQSINLQIGQQLLIPSLEITARVTREKKLLTLEDHG